MLIFDPSVRYVLEALLSSTTRRFYVSELIEHSELSAPTVYKVLNALENAEMVTREQERRFENEFRAPRVYYSLTEYAIDVLRLSTTP